MNCNRFLGILFGIAIVYQFYEFSRNTFESKQISNNLEMFNDSVMFKFNEQHEAIKHLVKPKRYELSKEGKDFIKSHETCVLNAYNDPDPKRRSVGWGHQIQPGEKLEHITQAKADELFEQDIEWVNEAINRLVSRNDNRFVYSQGFIDGLGSLIYNCGERGVTLTEFWIRWQNCRYDKDSATYINENDLSYTIAAVKTSRISAPGHIERRYDEHIMMLN